MSNYRRVLPRDLFNEANLLKCLGRLWIVLDDRRGHTARIVEEDVPAFDIVQNEATGGIYVRNLTFAVGGREFDLERPLNSRQPWPLYVSAADDPDFEEIAVFDDGGQLTPEMRAFIGLEE